MRDGDGPVLMITPGATRIDTSAESSDLVWPQDGRRVTLGRRTLQVLAQFAVPAAAGDVARRLEKTAPGSGQAVHGAVRSLVEAGVLCEFTPPMPAGVSRRTGLFGAPVAQIGDAVRTAADFVVLGVPYDLGATYRAGSRFGPEALRRVSTTVFQVSPEGMYDPERASALLPGAGIVDAGDLVGTPGELGGDLLDGLERAVSVIAGAGRVPVVLGGDHSLTLRVIDGLAGIHPRIGVLHFDAHHDYGRVRTAERVGVHHGNFLDWVVGSPAVECVAQFGIRQLTAHPPEPSPKLRRWAGLSALETSLDDIVSALPDGLVWHLTFDVDVLDPAVMPSTGTVLPGGYSYREAVTLVTGLCDRLPVAGLDVTEFLPGADEAPGVTVAGLLARALHHVAAFRASR
jgi:agmatinase